MTSDLLDLMNDIASNLYHEFLLKKQQEELEKYREITNLNNIVIKTDTHLNITYVNDLFCDISGFTSDDFEQLRDIQDSIKTNNKLIKFLVFVLIIGVIEGSVAEQAGIKSGDIIKKVDDVEYTGEQLDAVSSKVKGEEGTNVKITILRDNEEKEFNITRSNKKIKTVKSSG